MKNLKALFTKEITSRPDIMQFAKDRKYEESWILPINEERPTEDIIHTYLKKEPFELVIVEYIWNSHNDDNRFVLTLFLDKKCKLQDPFAFISLSLDLFYSYHSFGHLIHTIDTRIIGNEYLLCYPPDTANISVFNHWLSVGPVTLWDKGEVFDKEKVTALLKTRPEIVRTKLNYQGLLFRFNISSELNGPVYGIKTPCCKKEGDEWLIDLDKVDYWMRKVTQ